MTRTYSDYSASVVRLMQRQSAAAAANRQSAIQGAQGAAAVGFDLGSITASVSNLTTALPSPDPVADVLTAPVVNAVASAFGPAVAAATGGPAGAIAAATGIPAPAVQAGVNAARSAVSGPALEAARSAHQPSEQAAFDAGVALAAGAAKFGVYIPKGLTPAEKAAWLVTHGVHGATTEVKTGVMKTIAAHHEMVKGAKNAVKGIVAGVHPAKLVDSEMTPMVLAGIGLGAILGGVVGGMLGGPWGAALGAAAGGGGATLVTKSAAFEGMMEKPKGEPPPAEHTVKSGALAPISKSAGGATSPKVAKGAPPPAAPAPAGELFPKEAL